MAVTLPMAFADYAWPSGERRFLADLYFAGLPLLISFALVVVSSVVVGLPVHFMLQKMQIASRRSYVFAGSVAGLLVTLIVLLAIGAAAGFWMVFLGAFSGAATALSWSKSFEVPLATATT